VRVVGDVPIGGSCLHSQECRDYQFASCERGRCVCQSQYFNQNNRCGMCMLTS